MYKNDINQSSHVENSRHKKQFDNLQNLPMYVECLRMMVNVSDC